MTAKPSQEWKTRLLLTAGALFLLSGTASAGFGANGEDNAQLISRINQLENQIQTLSRAVYKGESRPLPMAGAPNGRAGVPAGVVYSDDDMVSGAAASAAGYEDRLSALEASQRRITGQLEQMSNDIQQLKQRVNRSAALDTSSSSYSGSGTARDSGPVPSYRNRPASMTEEYGGVGGGNDPQRGKILGRLGSSSSGGAENPGQLYDDAFNDIRDARYDQAANKFQRFLSSYPSHSLAANAQYWLAETYYVRQDYKQGAKLFAQNYQDYPKGSKASASLLKLGLSLARLGKKDDACLTFSQLKKEFPGDQTPEVQRAQKEIQQLGCRI